ncbi:MAG: site-specific integrase [Prevotellaceae bacterium]|nr:site-specific integrase [Prevotellaceae bacterium]
MASIKLRFREPHGSGEEGSLYFQVIHHRVSRRLHTGIHVSPTEWDPSGQRLIPASFSRAGEQRLAAIRAYLATAEERLRQALGSLEASGNPFTTDDILQLYNQLGAPSRLTIFQFAQGQIDRLRTMGKERTAECYHSAMVALRAFWETKNDPTSTAPARLNKRNHLPLGWREDKTELHFEMMDSDLIERFEAHLRRGGVCRNTISFYMRNLRAIINRAAREGLTARATVFENVYTGVDRTPKRAILLRDVKLLRRADLSAYPYLDFARDMFIFSFLTRGMSFVDMAHLQARNLSGGYLTYVRRKTGQQLTIRWRREMQQIVDKYSSRCQGSAYLLPIISLREGEEEGILHRRQYLSTMQCVNRNLHRLAVAADLRVRLTMYVARHSWASAARDKRVPTAVISRGMGHDSERTTEIYLASIQNNKVDDANDKIISSL